MAVREDFNRPGATLDSAVSVPVDHRRATPGSPNVVVILLDDTGFAQIGAFGSDIATPTFDRLARDGLRYNRFHVTSLCSPTRASLLTGRNHHAIGMGMLADISLGFPGYTGMIPPTAAMLPRILRDEGYSTMAIGKWHLTPRGQRNAAGPFGTWPLGQGFERYYGVLHGGANLWSPNLISDNHAVDPPSSYADGYHFCTDMADNAIGMIRDQKHASPDKPFFLYYADVATHAPHHVHPEWTEPYHGRYDDGWEAWRKRVFDRQVGEGIVPDDTVLPDRPPWVQAWSGLDPDAQRLFARMHELYAAYLTHADRQIGRVIDFLDQIGELDNTVVVVASDNGASAEGGSVGSVNEHRFSRGMPESVAENLHFIDQLGGPTTYNHYAWGWAWAGNTPFKLWKRYAWLGGTRTPLIIHWPAGITAASGQVRDQFCHAIDLYPTLLDACGITSPDVVEGVEQQSIHGASLRPTFDDAAAPSPRSTQYFEMLGSRAIIDGNWKATTDHVLQVHRDEIEFVEGSHDFATDTWALHDLSADFAEANDQAADHPEVLQRLVDTWWEEAAANNVLPLEDSFLGRLPYVQPAPYPAPTRAIYRPGGSPIADESLPMLLRGFEMRCRLVIAADGPSGAVFTIGDWTQGMALYGLDGAFVCVVNVGGEEQKLSVPTAHRGATEVSVQYRSRVDGGTLALGLDGDIVGEMQLPLLLPNSWQNGGTGLRIGLDGGLPVSGDYEPPFPWTGTIAEIEIVVPDGLRPDQLAIAKDALASD